jgi:hypothetical protein
MRREQSVEQSVELGLVGVDTQVSGDSAHEVNPRRAGTGPAHPPPAATRGFPSSSLVK